jgi:hypothetical protein
VQKYGGAGGDRLHQSRRYWLLETRRPRNSGEEKQKRKQFREQQRFSAGKPANEERESNWNECDRPKDDDGCQTCSRANSGPKNIAFATIPKKQLTKSGLPI